MKIFDYFNPESESDVYEIVFNDDFITKNAIKANLSDEEKTLQVWFNEKNFSASLVPEQKEIKIVLAKNDGTIYKKYNCEIDKIKSISDDNIIYILK